MAETEGFEPSMELQTPYSLSRGAPSASRPRLLFQARIIQVISGLVNLYWGLSVFFLKDGSSVGSNTGMKNGLNHGLF